MTDRTEQRSLGHVQFRHPEKVLMNLGPLQLQLAASNADERLRALRTNKLKSDRERWHGALLTYAWSKIWEKGLLYAHLERQDYDIIVRSDTDRALMALFRLVWVRCQTPWSHAAGVVHALRLKGEAGRWVSLPATR